LVHDPVGVQVNLFASFKENNHTFACNSDCGALAVDDLETVRRHHFSISEDKLFSAIVFNVPTLVFQFSDWGLNLLGSWGSNHCLGGFFLLFWVVNWSSLRRCAIGLNCGFDSSWIF
jgi:hypothetical protein